MTITHLNILAALDKGPATTRQLQPYAGVQMANVRAALHVLHKLGKVYRSGWVKHDVPIWAKGGLGWDAPRPEKMTKAQISKSYRKRRQARYYKSQDDYRARNVEKRQKADRDRRAAQRRSAARSKSAESASSQESLT